jgi:serine/threonine protein kinase
MKFDLNAPIYSKIDPIELALLKGMLSVDPKTRITAAEALSHPFFRNEIIS